MAAAASASGVGTTTRTLNALEFAVAIFWTSRENGRDAAVLENQVGVLQLALVVVEVDVAGARVEPRVHEVVGDVLVTGTTADHADQRRAPRTLAQRCASEVVLGAAIEAVLGRIEVVCRSGVEEVPVARKLVGHHQQVDDRDRVGPVPGCSGSIERVVPPCATGAA